MTDDEVKQTALEHVRWAVRRDRQTLAQIIASVGGFDVPSVDNAVLAVARAQVALNIASQPLRRS